MMPPETPAKIFSMMGFRVILSSDRKEATIYRQDGSNFNLYHSEGKVEDLVAFFTLPIDTNKDVTMKGYLTSLEDTAIIEINKEAA